jgi:hypothetical protein
MCTVLLPFGVGARVRRNFGISYRPFYMGMPNNIISNKILKCSTVSVLPMAAKK